MTSQKKRLELSTLGKPIQEAEDLLSGEKQSTNFVVRSILKPWSTYGKNALQTKYAANSQYGAFIHCLIEDSCTGPLSPTQPDCAAQSIR